MALNIRSVLYDDTELQRVMHMYSIVLSVTVIICTAVGGGKMHNCIGWQNMCKLASDI